MGKRSHTRAFIAETPALALSAQVTRAWAVLLQRRGHYGLPRRWRRKLAGFPEWSFKDLHVIVLQDFHSGLKTQSYIAATWLRQLALVVVQLRIED